MQKKLQKELGPAAQKEDKPKDPLLQVAEAMREVQQRLDQRDSGAVTQHVQRQIVADLAKLIEAGEEIGILRRQGLQTAASRRAAAEEAGAKPGQPAGEFSAARPGKRSEDPQARGDSRRGGGEGPSSG